jgi:hypothetical protein
LHAAVHRPPHSPAASTGQPISQYDAQNENGSWSHLFFSLNRKVVYGQFQATTYPATALGLVAGISYFGQLESTGLIMVCLAIGSSLASLLT